MLAADTGASLVGPATEGRLYLEAAAGRMFAAASGAPSWVEMEVVGVRVTELDQREIAMVAAAKPTGTGWDGSKAPP